VASAAATMTSRRFGRATASGLGARASVASAAGAQEEPLLGGVAVPRDGHGSRRDAAAHVCVLLCSYECIFPFFSCTGSVHLLCAVVFAFPGPLALLLVLVLSFFLSCFRWDCFPFLNRLWNGFSSFLLTCAVFMLILSTFNNCLLCIYSTYFLSFSYVIVLAGALSLRV